MQIVGDTAGRDYEEHEDKKLHCLCNSIRWMLFSRFFDDCFRQLRRNTMLVRTLASSALI